MNTNILVTSYATEMSPSQTWGGDPTSLDLVTYGKILDMLTASGEKHFNLIGGDPILHPHFNQILEKTNDWCKNHSMTATIVTAGSCLEDYIASIGAYVDIVIEFSLLENFTNIKDYTAIYNVISHMDNLGWFDNNKAVCRFEIHPSVTSYEYAENLFTSFKFKKVQVNFVPAAMEGSLEEYYNALKSQFLCFCKLAYKHHIKIEVNQYNAIPICYFNEEEKAIIALVCDNYPKYTQAFRLVILPNLECVYDRFNNLYQNTQAFLSDFDSLDSLNKYLLLSVYYPLTTGICNSRCAVCKQADLFKCDGRYIFGFDTLNDGNLEEAKYE